MRKKQSKPAFGGRWLVIADCSSSWTYFGLCPSKPSVTSVSPPLGWRVENQAARGTRVPSGFVALSGLFASAFEALAA